MQTPSDLRTGLNRTPYESERAQKLNKEKEKLPTHTPYKDEKELIKEKKNLKTVHEAMDATSRRILAKRFSCCLKAEV
jgi:hypothetical protein